MKEKAKRNWRRRALSVLLCVGIGWAVYTEALALLAWHFARITSDGHPNLAVLPEPLPTTPPVQLNGVRIAHFGFSFQVPWKDVDQDRLAKDMAATMSFRDGGGLLVFNPATQVDGAKIMRGYTVSQEQMMEKVFGKLALSSNYEFMAAAVQTTPDQVKWWKSRKQNNRNAIMLVNKSGDLREGRKIYKLASGELRGFQFGDPNVAPYIVQLDLFDPSDRHYRIFITPSKQKNPVISQAQINALITSIQ